MAARRSSTPVAPAASTPAVRNPSPARNAARRVADADAIAAQVADRVIAELSDSRTFGTGSKGFNLTTKITVDGARFQVGCNAVLVGSKDNPKLKVSAKRADVAEKLSAMLTVEASAHTYKSGPGVYAGGKIVVAGQRFQVGCNIVPIA